MSEPAPVRHSLRWAIQRPQRSLQQERGTYSSGETPWGVDHDTGTLQSMCAATRKRRVLGYIASPQFSVILAVKARSGTLLACSIVFISCGEAAMTALGQV